MCLAFNNNTALRLPGTLIKKLTAGDKHKKSCVTPANKLSETCINRLQEQ